MLTRGTDARSPCEICASIRRPLTGEMHRFVHSKHLSVTVCQHQDRLPHQTRPCIWSHGEILNVLCEGEANFLVQCSRFITAATEVSVPSYTRQPSRLNTPYYYLHACFGIYFQTLSVLYVSQKCVTSPAQHSSST
jgi:hypothetical protein